MAKTGWIKLHRQIVNHEFYQEPRKFSKFEAWIDILLRANHEDSEEIKPGSFPTSYGELAKAWGWSKKTVWNFLRYLAKENMITLLGNEKETVRETVVVVVKWELYQSKRNGKGNEKETKSESLPIIDKEEKNIYSEIFSFWNEQGIVKHQELTPAMRKAIDKITKELSLEQIKICMERYKTVLDDDSYFFSYRWSLVDFLNRKAGIKDFLDDGAKWASYQGRVKPKSESPIDKPNPYQDQCPDFL